MGIDRFKFVTKEAEEDMEKGFDLWNTQSAYTICSLKFFSDCKITCENALEEA